MSIHAQRFKEFLTKKVPAEFHEGLGTLAKGYDFIQGKGLEAKYSQIEIAFFDDLARLTNSGCPMVLQSRDRVTYAPAGSTKAPLGEDQYKGILGGHCYAVERTWTDPRADIKWIHITNPWGRYVRTYDEATGKAIEVTGNVRGLGDGRFRISLYDLFKKFECYSYCTEKI
jgi:hypothetical protein